MKVPKRRVTVLVVVALTVLVSLGLFGGLSLAQKGSAPRQLTIAEAMENVRQFEGASLPDLTLSQMPDDDVPFYEFKSGKTIYDVDPFSGEVTLALYLDRSPRSTEVVLSMDEASQRAAAFAEQHYSSYSRLTLTQRKMIDHGTSGKEYFFLWTQIVEGATTPNRVFTRVNPITGDVFSYGSRYQIIEPFAPPTVSKEEAQAIARRAFEEHYAAQGITLREVSVAEPTLEVIMLGGQQRLAWRVEVREPEQLGQIIRGADYAIDAYSGAILETAFLA